MQRHPSLDDRFDPAVRIVAHDPEWPAQAEAEMGRIAATLGGLTVRIEHIGSTSVRGLAAKPIIDMQLSVASIEPIEAYRDPLEGLGYLFVSDPGLADWHFFARPPQRPRTHHLHVVEAGSHQERRHLAVRDYLRTHPRETAEYEGVKRHLATEHPQDRLAYIQGKAPFVGALEQRALVWAGIVKGQSP